MQITSRKKVQVLVELDLDEAIWLRDLLQNAEDVTTTDSELRQELFTSLKKAIAQ